MNNKSQNPTNTKTSQEIVEAYNIIMKKWNLRSGSIQKNFIYTEDSLPWIEVEGNIKSKKEAKTLAQELADGLNVKVIFIRLEADSKESTVYMSFDLNIEQFRNKKYMGAISRYGENNKDYGSNEEAQDYLEEDGEILMPREL